MWEKTRNALKFLRESSTDNKSDDCLNASTDSAYDSSPEKRQSSPKGYYETVQLIGISGKKFNLEMYRSAAPANNVYKTSEPVQKNVPQKNQHRDQRRNPNNNRSQNRGRNGWESEVTGHERQKIFGPKMVTKKRDDKTKIVSNSKQLTTDAYTKDRNAKVIVPDVKGMANDIKEDKKVGGNPKVNSKAVKEVPEEQWSPDLLFKSENKLSNIKVHKKSSDVKIETVNKGSSYYRDLLAIKPGIDEVKTLLCPNGSKGVISTRASIKRVVINI